MPSSVAVNLYHYAFWLMASARSLYALFKTVQDKMSLQPHLCAGGIDETANAYPQP